MVISFILKVLSALEDKLRNFHMKIIKDDDSLDKPKITQLRRFNIQVSQKFTLYQFLLGIISSWQNGSKLLTWLINGQDIIKPSNSSTVNMLV